MNKKRLLQILTALPENTSVGVVFSFGKTYLPEKESKITGINVVENKDKTLTIVLCGQEKKEEAA